MGKHTRKPHILQTTNLGGGGMLTTQYGPVCRICGRSGPTRWHIGMGPVRHRRTADA